MKIQNLFAHDIFRPINGVVKADQLDDGVKVNYGKFGDLLAEVKAVCGTE